MPHRMLLFQKRFHEGLKSGKVTLTFRRWDKPRVRVGGRYRCHPIGVLEVRGLERAKVGAIGADDARRAGFESRAALVEYITSATGSPLDDDTEVFRVELAYGGDGDRVEIALDDALSPHDVAAIEAKLARMDGDAPWTRQTLRLIAAHPRVAASKLAAKVKRETLPFKVDVRKLKKLGLTQSFEVGYELSPRGKRLLELKPKAAKTRATKASKTTKASRPKPAKVKRPRDPVAAYIASQPPPIAKALARVRSIIQRVAPDAVEAISYRIAGYKLDGRVLIYFAGFPGHYSLYPATTGVKAALGKDLARHAHGKGTLRFDAAEPVPVKTIERAVKARMQEVRAKS